jgi:alkanesulfonate monooxygenase SsuD/methylene tetrahydromethanopterin reductase-like flavin-dependent oxidoreductase (luciferase family)
MLSGGRVNWGAGRGFAPSEFNAFGVPIEESAVRQASWRGPAGGSPAQVKE